jgi:threonylcarbamoyladenosine tRNA methylthiotransferase MtaB
MKIFLDTIGCRLNQAEIEIMARQFLSAGHEIVPSAEQADLAVINTCSVTSAAAADSRAAIRRVKRLGAREVVVTGCWATLEPEKAAGLPGVNKVIANLQKENLAVEVLNIPKDTFDLEPIARRPIPGSHRRTRAFIKVQDGCNNACTFCITTIARGTSRSRSINAVISDIESALKGGAKEIVLTGVHLGSWGQDFPIASRLENLIAAILKRTAVPRLRLSSLEPWDLEADFFHLWADSRLCRYLHLPLQSGSASVLKRMARKTTPDSYRILVESARAIIPDMAITTDVIAGFPGETQAEFQETLEYIKSIKFAGGHVFSYSSRPGTAAARMKDQIGFEIRKNRSSTLRELFTAMEHKYQENFLGSVLSVIWEASSKAAEGFQVEGLTDNYIKVTASAPDRKWNEVDEVLLVSIEDNTVKGTIEGSTSNHSILR